MGMIADELDRNLATMQAMLSAKVPIMVNGTSFSTPAGPVTGVASLELSMLYQQMDELAKAIGKISKAIRKLEDTKKF